MAEDVFFQVVRVCSWIIAAVCFLGGLGLLIGSKAMVTLNRALNRVFSTVVLERTLGKSVDIDQCIVRRRVVLGVIALVVSIIISLQLIR